MSQEQMFKEALEYIYDTTPYCKRRLAGRSDTCRDWAMEDLDHCPHCIAGKALGKPLPPRKNTNEAPSLLNAICGIGNLRADLFIREQARLKKACKCTCRHRRGKTCRKCKWVPNRHIV